MGVCTPYMPFPTTDLLRTLVNGEDERMYMLWFQEPGVAEAVLDGQVELMFDVSCGAGSIRRRWPRWPWSTAPST